MNIPSEKGLPPAEFDSYSENYSAGMENPIKDLMGASADAYVATKLHWLLRRFPEVLAWDSSFRVLDYGCGIATLLRLMVEAGISASLAGCDVSAGMLHEAERRWPARFAKPAFHVQQGSATSLRSESVDLIVISAVLHHIPPQDRADVYRELARLLRPNGRLVVFEHNPFNPVTRYVVAHTPIDRNAVLLPPSEVRAGLRVVGLVNSHTEFLMFLPPSLGRLTATDAALRWLPLGAQYAVWTRR